MSVITFTGGKRCEECDEQIDPRRLRLNPRAKLCTGCEQDWELRQRTALNSAPASAVVIIRR
jgi:RNA polymerase-binding transcription factor DksA